MEKNTRYVRIISMRKEVVGRVQDVVGKKKFWVKLKHRKRIYMSTWSPFLLCDEEEVVNL